MALNSIVTLVGDGTTTDFSFSFTGGYNDESHVFCQVGGETDGSGDPVYRSITFLSVGTIRVGGAVPTSGQEVKIFRQTPITNAINDFADGEVLDESSLDASFDQLIKAAQELNDALAEALTAEQAATAAQGSETAAANSATNAATSATNAANSAVAAAASASAASASETATAGVVAAAQGHANAASASEFSASSDASSANAAAFSANSSSVAASGHATAAAASEAQALVHRNAAGTSETNAGLSAAAAASDAADAASDASAASASASAAATSATDAANAVAGINLPSLGGGVANFIMRVNGAGDGYEVVNSSGLSVGQLNGVSASNYARTDLTETFVGEVRLSKNSAIPVRLGYNTGGTHDTYIPFYRGNTTRVGYLQSLSDRMRLWKDGGAYIDLLSNGIGQLNGSGIITNSLLQGRIGVASAGGVGTYAFARWNGSDSAGRSFGDTVAGLSLDPSNADGTEGTQTMSGSWRCMGRARNTTEQGRSTLWLRIS